MTWFLILAYLNPMTGSVHMEYGLTFDTQEQCEVAAMETIDYRIEGGIPIGQQNFLCVEKVETAVGQDGKWSAD